MTDKQKAQHEARAWVVTLSLLITGIWATHKIVNKLTEPHPPVNCPHIPFATVDDMRQLTDELDQCRKGR